MAWPTKAGVTLKGQAAGYACTACSGTALCLREFSGNRKVLIRNLAVEVSLHSSVECRNSNCAKRQTGLDGATGCPADLRSGGRGVGTGDGGIVLAQCSGQSECLPASLYRERYRPALYRAGNRSGSAVAGVWARRWCED